MSNSILSMEGVSKAYAADAPVLQDVTFELAPNQFLALVGPSGCGKTTMLRCISALMKPDSGVVFHAGEIFDDPPAWLSIVFQDYNRSLFPWLSVRRNVALALRDASKSERDDRVKEALDAVKLTHAADLYPWQLSGGMQQRCALARSIVSVPKLLLLDEPFALGRRANAHRPAGPGYGHLRQDVPVSAACYPRYRRSGLHGRQGSCPVDAPGAWLVEEIEINLPRPRKPAYYKGNPRVSSPASPCLLTGPGAGASGPK